MQYLDCSVLHKRLAPPVGTPLDREGPGGWSEPPAGSAGPGALGAGAFSVDAAVGALERLSMTHHGRNRLSGSYRGRRSPTGQIPVHGILDAARRRDIRAEAGHDLRGARTSGATCSKSWSSPLWQRRLEGKRRKARTSGRPAIALTPVRRC
jgi:hypothetical protein